MHIHNTLLTNYNNVVSTPVAGMAVTRMAFNLAARLSRASLSRSWLAANIAGSGRRFIAMWIASSRVTTFTPIVPQRVACLRLCWTRGERRGELRSIGAWGDPLDRRDMQSIEAEPVTPVANRRGDGWGVINWSAAHARSSRVAILLLMPSCLGFHSSSLWGKLISLWNDTASERGPREWSTKMSNYSYGNRRY